MTRKRRWVLGALAVGLVYFLFATGWMTPARPWREVAGVTRLTRVVFFDHGKEPVIYWLGHAGFLINWHGQWIALDPNLSTTCLPVKRLTPVPEGAWPERVDAAVISHAHYDHFDLPTLTRLKGLKQIVAPKGLDDFLPDTLAKRLTFTGLGEGQSTVLGEVQITAVHTRHRGGRKHPLPSSYQALGYIIGDGELNIFFAGDSGYGEHFAEIGQRYHPRIAILPIGAYAPHFALAPHHLDPEEAVRAALDLGSETVIPGHFGTFRLAFDAPDAALPRFAQAARKAQLTWCLAPLYGESKASP